MEKFHVVYTQDEEELLPGLKIATFGMHLVDGDNKPVSIERLEEAYRNLSATGYKVMLRVPTLADESYPVFAEVERITEDGVYLIFGEGPETGSRKISRAKFHEYYEVD